MGQIDPSHAGLPGCKKSETCGPLNAGYSVGVFDRSPFKKRWFPPMHGPSLLFAVMILVMVTTLTLLFAWLSNRDALGMREWFGGCLLAMVNIAVFLARPPISPAMSVFIMQALTIGTGAMHLLAAYQYLQYKPVPKLRIALISAIGALAIALLVLQGGSPVLGFGLGSAVTGTFFMWGAVLFWRKGAAPYPARKFAGTASFLHGAFLCGRVFLYKGGTVSLISNEVGWNFAQLITVEQLIMTPLLGLCILLLINEKRQAQLKVLAEEDALTGAFNRRAFLQSLEKVHVQVRATKQPLSVLVMDVDHFKSINDQHGHSVGDEALRQIAALIAACLRRDDVMGRIGGEEFAIYLPNTDRQAALGIAERIRANVCAVPLRLGTVTLSCSVSIGVSAFNDGDSLDEVLIRGDRGMYSAKFSGRNRIALA